MSASRVHDGDSTTRHVAAARAGDRDSLAWLVRRLSPWLMVQARYRLRGALAGVYDAEDLVQDVWLAAVTRLPHLRFAGERQTPVLLRYLSRTLLYRVRDLLEKHARGEPGTAPPRAAVPELLASVTDALSASVRREAHRLLHRAIAELPETDREVLVLRGIEQHPQGEVAAVLGVSANAVAMRYQRARRHLRDLLVAHGLDRDLPP